MNLNELAKQIHEDNKAKGFWEQERKRIESLALIICEASEAIEADREGKEANIEGFDFVQKNKPAFAQAAFLGNIKDTFQDEIADVFIRLLDLCGHEGIDIEKHIHLKLEYNRTRPYKHNKKY